MLDHHVGLADTDPMMDHALPDIPVPPGLFPDESLGEAASLPRGGPMPGALTAAQAAADRAELLSGDVDRLEVQVLEILAAAQHREMGDLLSEERAADGGVALDGSMVAVFVIQIIEQALGGAALSLRGHSEPDDFRSSRTLAGLLQRLLVSRLASA